MGFDEKQSENEREREIDDFLLWDSDQGRNSKGLGYFGDALSMFGAGMAVICTLTSDPNWIFAEGAGLLGVYAKYQNDGWRRYNQREYERLEAKIKRRDSR